MSITGNYRKQDATEDMMALFRTLYGEAQSGNEADAIAVAHVVMNRVRLPNWPNTIRAVCFQPWQFSCWNMDNPRLQKITDAQPNDTTWTMKLARIADGVMNGSIPDPTNRSTHYFADYIKPPKWVRGKVPVLSNPGGSPHKFYNDIDTPPPATAKEALDQQRPLSQSGTVKGGLVAAGAGGAGLVIEVLEGAQDAAHALTPYTYYLEWLSYVVGVLAVLGAAYTVYRRVMDREAGRN